MTEAQLWTFFKKNNIGLEEISARTGYTVRYVLNLIMGNDIFNNKARRRFIKAFPETAAFLLAETTEK